MSTTIDQLREMGQSLWLDFIRRSTVLSGEMQRMVDEDGIVGMTSNPTIFQLAVAAGTDYDEQLLALARQGKSPHDIYEAVTVRDIQMAADILRPIYEGTGGRDGYVSIEVSPDLANDTAGTIEEAHRLFRLTDRPNVMVKVPGTPAGLPAIEQLIGEGRNINITLLFAVEVHEQVMEAYLRGLERLIREGRPLEPVASVASFFVSRVDSLVDKRLEEKLAATADPAEQAKLRGLLGKAAIANAKVAYQRFRQIFSERRFMTLEARGARVQRPLWASTSTKNPAYRDVLYVEELIGPDTVNTVPPATLKAFQEHGRVRPSLEDDLAGAQAVVRQLAAVGIDLREVTQELQVQGVKLFADSYHKLLADVERKCQVLLTSGQWAVGSGQ